MNSRHILDHLSAKTFNRGIGHQTLRLCRKAVDEVLAQHGSQKFYSRKYLAAQEITSFLAYDEHCGFSS